MCGRSVGGLQDSDDQYQSFVFDQVQYIMPSDMVNICGPAPIAVCKMNTERDLYYGTLYYETHSVSEHISQSI